MNAPDEFDIMVKLALPFEHTIECPMRCVKMGDFYRCYHVNLPPDHPFQSNVLYVKTAEVEEWLAQGGSSP